MSRLDELLFLCRPNQVATALTRVAWSCCSTSICVSSWNRFVRNSCKYFLLSIHVLMLKHYAGSLLTADDLGSVRACVIYPCITLTSWSNSSSYDKCSVFLLVRFNWINCLGLNKLWGSNLSLWNPIIHILINYIHITIMSIWKDSIRHLNNCCDPSLSIWWSIFARVGQWYIFRVSIDIKGDSLTFSKEYWNLSRLIHFILTGCIVYKSLVCNIVSWVVI